MVKLTYTSIFRQCINDVLLQAMYGMGMCMDRDAFSKIFGNKFNYYVTYSEKLVSEINSKEQTFGYLSNEVFHEILHSKKFSDANEILCRETLQRLYIACITAHFRQHSWVCGIVDSYKSQNYILLASAIRGFLESSCDFYYSLCPLPLTIAENYMEIDIAVKGKMHNSLIGLEQLEKPLLHFQEAQRQGVHNSVEPYLKAETAKKYMEHEHFNELNLYKMYGDLCQITHPAKQSLSVYLQEHEYLLKFRIHLENEINALVEKCFPNMERLLEITSNLIIVSLKTLNLFSDNHGLFTKTVEEYNMNDIPLWKKIIKNVK